MQNMSRYWRSPMLQKRILNYRQASSYGGKHARGRVVMPTVPGSPAYQTGLIQDAMAIVVRFGPPTYFIVRPLELTVG
eukprot:SAG31_NODE_16905_length_690_cov_43.917090_2_plen_78_part_00